MKKLIALLALVPAVASAHSFLPFRLESPYKETVLAQFNAANYGTSPNMFEVVVYGPNGKISEDAYAAPAEFGLKPGQSRIVKVKIDNVPEPGIYKVCTVSAPMEIDDGSGAKAAVKTKICSAWGVGVSPYDKSMAGAVSDKKMTGAK